MPQTPTLSRFRAVSVTILLFFTLASRAASADVSKLGQAEYVKLAEELSHKVDLFRDVWQEDGNTQIFGGTIRDYLYWLKGRFKSAATPEQAQEIAAKLRARQTIQVREFVVGESDVDLIRETRSSLDRDRYGVSKIDVISPARFDASTP